MDFTKHLLVDGSNIVHAWPELRRVLASEGREVARDRLVAAMRPIHDAERIRVSVVFDGRGAAIAIERPGDEATFSVLYTPAGMTADDLIEQLVAQTQPASLATVATGDAAERRTVEALGAAVVSPEQLAEWVARSGAGQSAAVERHNEQSARAWRRRE